MHVTVPFSILFYAYIPTTPCMGRLLHPACCPPSCEPGCSSLGAFKNAGIYAPFFGALCTAAFLAERERALINYLPAAAWNAKRGKAYPKQRRRDACGSVLYWAKEFILSLPKHLC